MNFKTTAPSTQSWQHAADAMPQLICLVDRDGRVLHANRTLTRWQLGVPEQARGLDLHQVLHPNCSDPDCHMRLYWRRTALRLAQHGRADCQVWDACLKRHLEIRTMLPVANEDAPDPPFFAVINIDDVSHLKSGGHRAREAARLLNRRVEGEVQRRVQAIKARSPLLTVLDKTPVFIGMSDHNGVLYYLNPTGRNLIGLGEQEALAGLTLAECYAPHERSRIGEQAMLTAQNEGAWSDDAMLSSRSGQEIRVHLTLLSHQDEHAQLSGFTLMGRDMRDWMRNEEALRITQDELCRLAAQHLTIQENERRRIALDLHDGLGQTLSLVKLSIEEATRSMSTGSSGQAAQTLAGLGPTVKSALTELRRISMNLRPSTLDDLGILATLSWYFREFESACPELHLQREVSVAEADVPDLLKITIFRIVQEATGNALKHAKADRLRVRLKSQEGALILLIEDNGQGFDPELGLSQHAFGSGLGLQSMQERAELSGADYALTAAPGQGTRIEVLWPKPGGVKRGLATSEEASTPQQPRSPFDRRSAQNNRSN